MFEGAAIEGGCSENRIVVEMRVESHIFLVHPADFIGTQEKRLLYQLTLKQKPGVFTLQKEVSCPGEQYAHMYE